MSGFNWQYMTGFNFLKKNKIKDKQALHAALSNHYERLPHHESDEFDQILPTLLTESLLSGGLDTHFEPSPPIDLPDTSMDTSFDGGGGSSGGGGADGNW